MHRPRSPSTCPAPSWPPQPGEPGPAKRIRLDVPATGPQLLPQPGLWHQPWAPHALEDASALPLQQANAIALEQVDALALYLGDALAIQDPGTVAFQDAYAPALQQAEALALQQVNAIAVQEANTLAFQLGDGLIIQDPGTVALQDAYAPALQQAEALALQQVNAIAVQEADALALQWADDLASHDPYAVALQDTYAVALQEANALALEAGNGLPLQEANASVHYEADAGVGAHGLAPSSLSSVVVLPAGSALQLQHPEFGVHLLLEPPPMDAAHPHSKAQGQARCSGLGGLQLDALLAAAEQLVVVGQQQWACASVPKGPGQEDALQEAAPAASSASGPSELLAPSPWAAAPSFAFDLDCHLLRPLLPSSSLRPLPPSPSPAPQQRPENPQRPPRPACKARRRLLFK